eukprot:7445545-Pyramimonas_sp.AAC.1
MHELPCLAPSRFDLRSAFSPPKQGDSSKIAGVTCCDPHSVPHMRFAVAHVLAPRPRGKRARGLGPRLRCRYQDAAGLGLPGRMLALTHQVAARGMRLVGTLDTRMRHNALTPAGQHIVVTAAAETK